MTINRSTMVNHRLILMSYRIVELACVLLSVLIGTVFKTDMGVTLVKQLPGIGFERF